MTSFVNVNVKFVWQKNLWSKREETDSAEETNVYSWTSAKYLCNGKVLSEQDLSVPNAALRLSGKGSVLQSGKSFPVSLVPKL